MVPVLACCRMVLWCRFRRVRRVQGYVIGTVEHCDRE